MVPDSPFARSTGLGVTVRFPSSPARTAVSTDAAAAALPGLAKRLVTTVQSPTSGSTMETASLASDVAELNRTPVGDSTKRSKSLAGSAAVTANLANVDPSATVTTRTSLEGSPNGLAGPGTRLTCAVAAWTSPFTAMSTGSVVPTVIGISKEPASP